RLWRVTVRQDKEIAPIEQGERPLIRQVVGMPLYRVFHSERSDQVTAPCDLGAGVRSGKLGCHHAQPYPRPLSTKRSDRLDEGIESLMRKEKSVGADDRRR